VLAMGRVVKSCVRTVTADAGQFQGVHLTTPRSHAISLRESIGNRLNKSRLPIGRKTAMHELLTLEEVAKLFRVHRRTVYKWVRERKLRALHIGWTWRVPREAIDELKA
jgi:excisionase family DNA binding protein